MLYVYILSCVTKNTEMKQNDPFHPKLMYCVIRILLFPAIDTCSCCRSAGFSLVLVADACVLVVFGSWFCLFASRPLFTQVGSAEHCTNSCSSYELPLPLSEFRVHITGELSSILCLVAEHQMRL
jgi:hypothetical protein